MSNEQVLIDIVHDVELSPPLVSRAGLLGGNKIIDMPPSSPGPPNDWDDLDDWEVDRVFEALARIEQRLSAVEECSAPALSVRAAPAGCPEEDPDDWDDPDDWEVDRVFEALARIELRLSAIEACSAPAPSACVASGQ